jgi:hypothetical protein
MLGDIHTVSVDTVVSVDTLVTVDSATKHFEV